ncbi:hypothetical protein HX882_31910 [Pseudomonas gingeri]|uniref:Ig-like domain repeat protein n=1 Tax=Pseudomonas gingeri TaxID=117681 RepID=A0A7Y8C635_9PSED|nr:hypothetical protein [Pseudomonas gingeri]NWC00490.1 hypothetical protein [Pseudomonas gingeri]
MSRQKPRSGNTPLVLPEIEIPNGGPTYFPIPPDTTGINIGAARLTYPHDGLKLRIEPWPNMNRGDSYKIKLDTIPSVVGSIDTDEQVGKFVERFIGADYLPDGSYNLSYDVTRVGNPVPEASLLTPIFVKVENAPPGGQDLDAGTPGHSELHLSIPPEFLPPAGAVDKDAAAAGVPVTIEPYPIMVEGDRIKLSWGGEFVWRTVEDFEVGTPIVITVDEATILAAGDTDTSGLAVAFILYDVVDNESRGWSAEVRVVVDTGSSRLPAPLIAEAENLVLDMDQLGEAELTFQVFTFDGSFEIGDQIEMRLSGLTASGERVDKTYPIEVITNASGITQFTRPSTEVRALAGGIHATFFYRLIKADGSEDQFSKTFSPKVIGRSTILAAPVAYDEIAGTLDPDLPNTRVDIPWDNGMAAGNVIMLVWEGTTVTGTPYTPDLPLHPITANEVGKTIPISVDGGHLKAIEDGTLELYYWLLDDEINRASIRHESLHAGPFHIGPFVAELPAPVVQYESGGVLDPDDVPLTGTLLTVLQYTGQIEKDVVHILWWGSITGRYRDQITLNSVTDKIDVPFTIPKALVEGNRGGTVQALYWVKRANGRTSPSAILRMSIGAAMNLLAPSVKQATGTAPTQQLNPMAAITELTVVIPNYGILPGDQVSVTWTGSAGGGSHTTQVQVLPTDREITLPVSLIAYNLGKPVTVTYTVTRNGDESDPSAPLNLAVQSFTENDLLGSKPKLLEAANNGDGSELDLNTLSADGICRLTIWPHIAPDQDVWLRLKGTKADGTAPYDLNIWTPPPRGPRASQLWLDQGYYDTPIDYSYLKDLKDGSTLTIEFKADLSQTTNEANATTFPLRTYTIRAVALDAPNITDIRDSKRSVIDKITADTSVTVEGTGSSGQQIQLMDGSNNIGPVINIPAPGTTWDVTLTGLTVRAYSLKARALYGTGIPDSQAKAFIVTTASIPTLDSVKDDKGAEINEGDFTTSLLIDVDGTASRDQEVEIYDGNGASAELKGTTKADPVTGRWSLPGIAVTPEAHRFYAKALYNTGGTVYSNVRTFTVAAAMIPTLDSIKDDKGAEINEGDFTTSLLIDVDGTASRDQEVEIYDGNGATAELKGTAKADPVTGRWSLPGIAVTPKAHRFYAKALYNTGGTVYSNVRTFTVTDLVNPTLTDISDSKGSVVDGTTVENSVTVTGTGSKGQEIQLMDGISNIGSPFRVPDNSTTWSTPLNNLTTRAYNIKAKALYGNGLPESATKTFNVLASATPAITAVNESTTPAIPNGGVTAATSVVLTGSATPGLSIDLFDNLTSLKGTFVATGGTWTTTPPIAVTDGAHSFTAKAKYGSEPVSAAWTFTVITLTDQNKPYIQQAENNGTGATLDLGTFAGDATVKVSPWPGIKAGQRVWLRCLGKKANNADHIITLYTASAVVPAEERDGLSKNIPRAQLEELGDNTSLTVELKIKFNGSSSDDAATVFPLRTYTLKTVVAPTLTDICDSTGSVVDKFTVETSLTVTGTGSSGQQIQLMDGETNIGSPFRVPDDSRNWTTVLTGLTAKAYIIKARALYGTDLPDSAAKTVRVLFLQDHEFSDETTGPWVKGNGAKGSYIITEVSGAKTFRCPTLREDGNDHSGSVLSQAIVLKSGVRYSFSCRVRSYHQIQQITAQLYLKVNTTDIAGPARLYSFVWFVLEGEFTGTGASQTLHLWNMEERPDTVLDPANDFDVGYLKILELP